MMEIALTTEEIEYRSKKYPDVSKVIKADDVLKCTVCHKTVQNTPLGHPLLDVIVCKECHKFCDSDFSSDEDGTDKYCRWCGQGGTLYCCSQCKCAFCQKCVQRNCDEKVQDDIEHDDWKCFVCDVKPLWDVRAFCWAVLKDFKENRTKYKKFKKHASKTKHSSNRKAQSDSDSDSESESDSESRGRRNTRQKRKATITNGKKYYANDSSEDDGKGYKRTLRKSQTIRNMKQKKSEDSDDSSYVENKIKSVSKRHTRKSSNRSSDSETTHKKSQTNSKPKYNEESDSEEEEDPKARKKASNSSNPKGKTSKSKKDASSSDESYSVSTKKGKPSSSSKHNKSERVDSSYSTHNPRTPIKNKSSKIQDKDKQHSDSVSDIVSDATSKGGESGNETPDLDWLNGLIQDFTAFANKNTKKLSKIKELAEKRQSGEDVHDVCKVIYKEVKSSMAFLDTYKENVVGDYKQWKKKETKRAEKLTAKKKTSKKDKVSNADVKAGKKSAIEGEDAEKEESGTEDENGSKGKNHRGKTKEKEAKVKDSEEVEAENVIKNKQNGIQSGSESDQHEKNVSKKIKKSKADVSEEESNDSDPKKTKKDAKQKTKKPSSVSSEEEEEKSDSKKTKRNAKQKTKKPSSGSSEEEEEESDSKKTKRNAKQKTKKPSSGSSEENEDSDIQNKMSSTAKNHKKLSLSDKKKKNKTKKTGSDEDSDNKKGSDSSDDNEKYKISNPDMEVDEEVQKIVTQTTEDDGKTYFSGAEDTIPEQSDKHCNDSNGTQKFVDEADTAVNSSLAVLEEEASKLNDQLSNKVYDKLSKTIGRASLDLFSENESDNDESTVLTNKTIELSGSEEPNHLINENKHLLDAETESEVSHIYDDKQDTNIEEANETNASFTGYNHEILLATTQESLDIDENVADSTAAKSPVKTAYRESVATAICDSTDSERDVDASEFNNQADSNSDAEASEKIKEAIKSLECSVDEKGEEEEKEDGKAKRKSKRSVKCIDEDELCKNALLASSSSSSSLSNNEGSDSDNWAPKKPSPSKSLKPGMKFKAAVNNKREDANDKEKCSKQKMGPKSKIKGSKGETFRERNIRKAKEPEAFISNMDEFSDDIKLNCSCFVSLKDIEGEKVGGGKSKKRKAGHNSDDEIMNLADVDNVEKQRKKSSKKKLDDEEKPSKPKRLNKKKKDQENGSQTGSPVASDVESDSEEQTVNKNGITPIKSKTEDELAAEAILCSSNSENTETESDSEKKKKKEKKTKKESSEKEEEKEEEAEDNDDNDKKKKKKTKTALSDSEESDSEKKEKKKRPSWKNDKLLRAPLSDSNSEDDDKAFKKIQARHKKGEDSSDSDDEITIKKTRQKKKNKTRRQVLSDSDVELVESDDSSEDDKKEDKISSDEAFWNKKRKQKRGASSSDEESSSSGGKKKARKRRRIKKMSDSDSDDENLKSQKSDGTPGKRKNLRKILKEKDLEKTTQSAAQEEKERKQRIVERQKLYNEMYESRQLQEGTIVNELVLDFDPKTKETILEVHKDLVAKLKPHQAQGVKFMWDALFESVERAKKNKGSGCILAHCMGLGKTMQIVVLVHTLLTHPEHELGVRTVLVVTPLSTVNNWCSEFSMWLHKVGDGDEVQCYNMSQVRVSERAIMLKNWQKRGGVAVMGYDLFRNLSNDKSKRTKKATIDAYHRCLVDPGADLVVCDEGHLLKNEKSKLSESMSQVKTRKRVVLTGTPLQNNLLEYHCMIQFVKPNLLGKRAEFTNRFVNPIKNGQCADSTDRDVLVMKRRAHVLHKMLEGCVQRFDYTVLTPLLKSKHEYVIKIRLTEVQILMYTFYLNNLARAAQVNKGASLFSDYQNLQRVWTHPLVMQLRADREEDKMLDDEEDSAGSLKDFIDDDDDDDDSSGSGSGSNSNSNSSDSDIICEEDEDNPSKSKKRKKKEAKEAAKSKKKYRTRGAVADGEVSEEEKENQETMARNEWWSEFVKPEDLEVLSNSNKLVLLFSILKECEAIGDKVLVFSQSLLSLDLIENFLNKADNAAQENLSAEEFCGLTGSWSKGLDYFRLDGQTSTDLRTHWCKIFNNKNNLRARLFLISTRAGGLGINMVGANRVILFDASWNPSNDVQSIFRVYRFGQTKPCYIYRFLAAGTMEEKIYDRQVTKLALSGRVVDEHQIDRHFNAADLEELYSFNPIGQGDDRPTMLVPKDRLLAELLKEKSNVIESYHEHDSLLENKPEENLTEEERQMAWQDYETEKSHQENRLAMMEAAMQNQKAYMQAQIQAQMMQQQSFASMQDVNSTMNSALQGLLGNYLAQNNPNVTNMAGGSGANMTYEQQQRLYMLRQMQIQQQMAYQNAKPGAGPMLMNSLPMVMPRQSKPVDIVELDDDEPTPNNTKEDTGTGEKPKLKLRNDLF